VIYLLHFSAPYFHARHYLGSTDDLLRRLNQHRLGTQSNGSPLIEAAREDGIRVTLVRVWDGDWQLEYQLKAWHNGGRFCPLCDERALFRGNYDLPRRPPIRKLNAFVREALLSPELDLPDVLALLRGEGAYQWLQEAA